MEDPAARDRQFKDDLWKAFSAKHGDVDVRVAKVVSAYRKELTDAVRDRCVSAALGWLLRVHGGQGYELATSPVLLKLRMQQAVDLTAAILKEVE